MPRPQTGFIFDLDGTLVDNVYQHVLAWHAALREEGIVLSVWRIHRKIGMSGGLFVDMLLRETGLPIEPERIERVRQRHAVAYQRHTEPLAPLPGARELLKYLAENGFPVAIATSGHWQGNARLAIEALGIDRDRLPVITRDDVKHAKPDPDLFLAAAERLAIDIQNACVVGDSVWDMLAARRCHAFGIGLLSGGYGREELERGGAAIVYADPADLLRHIDEVGGRP